MILDGGCDTCVLGKGFVTLSTVPNRSAIILGATNGMREENLKIGTGATVITLNHEKFLLVINEAIISPSNNISLLSTHQIREFGNDVDDRAKHHGGNQ